MTRFTAIDLSALPPPDVIEVLDVDAEVAAIKADFRGFWDEERLQKPDLPEFDTLDLESEPAAVLIKAAAYRSLLLKAKVNDKARAVLLATALGTDLDHLGARVATARLEGELDEPFRARIQLGYEALSTAGPYGSYVYHARAAHPHVKSVGVYGPESGFVEPGRVLVSLLSNQGNGVPNPGVLEAVRQYLSAAERRPLTDYVMVEAAQNDDFTIIAEIAVAPGPDKDLIYADALARLEALVDRVHVVEGVAARSAILATLHLMSESGAPIVRSVNLISPTGDVGNIPRRAPRCSGITLRVLQ